MPKTVMSQLTLPIFFKYNIGRVILNFLVNSEANPPKHGHDFELTPRFVFWVLL